MNKKKKKNVHVHILIYNVHIGFFIYISTKQKKVNIQFLNKYNSNTPRLYSQW